MRVNYRMLWVLLIPVLLIDVPMSDVFAQIQSDTTRLDDYYIDFVAPDVSAFGMLGLDHSGVTEPASIKELAAEILQARDENGNVVSGIAMEWTPMYTLHSAVSNKGRVLRTLQYTQFSLATASSDSSGSLALGLRWMPLDEADPTRDRLLKTRILDLFAAENLRLLERNDINNRLDNYLDSICGPRTDIFLEIKKSMPACGDSDYVGPDDSWQRIQRAGAANGLELDEQAQAEIERYLRLSDAAWRAGRNEVIRVADSMITARKKDLKNKWNAAKLAIAMGSVFTSDDASWKAMKADRFAAFVGGSFPLSRIAQFVGQIKMSGEYRRRYFKESEFFFGGRLLVGNADRRFSAEIARTVGVEKDSSSEDPDAMRYAIGYEFKLTSGFWLEVVLATEAKDGGSVFDSRALTFANLKYALQKDRRFDIH